MQGQRPTVAPRCRTGTSNKQQLHCVYVPPAAGDSGCDLQCCPATGGLSCCGRIAALLLTILQDQKATTHGSQGGARRVLLAFCGNHQQT
jgi:hypothetical protein